MKPPILLADDHAIVVEGLRRILEDKFDVLAVVEDGQKLLDAIHEHRPEAVVCDVSMPVLNGLEALQKSQKARYRARFVFVTANADVGIATRAFRLGAAAYVLKQAAPEDLLVAMGEVLRGNTYIAPQIADQVLKRLVEQRPEQPAEFSLTSRERDVLALLAQGKTMKEAALELNLSTRTVEFHKSNIIEKTQIRSMAELSRYAAHLGLVPDSF